MTVQPLPETCPVASGCRDVHPFHGDEECQVDVGNGFADPQLAEQCPCEGACPGCGGHGTVEYGGRDYLCRSCSGTGSAA